MTQIVPFRCGGQIALDFVNTVDSWVRPIERDYISDFPKLAAWCAEVGILTKRDAARLASLSDSQTSAAFRKAHELRAMLLRVFGSVIDRRQVAAPDMAALNTLLRKARDGQCFVARQGQFIWFRDGEPVLTSPIEVLALEAAALLESGDVSRLKRCPGPDGCGWLFLDESRNRSRRWCSMEYCGSFAKARRFAEAHQHDH
jgi:predicted RNA-binding Zn ribbon-like protein